MNGIRWTRLAAALAWAAWGAAGCADGYGAGEASARSPLSSAGLPAPDAGAQVAGGAGADAVAAPVEAPVMDTGQPCSQGQTEVCVCEDTGTEGQRSCRFDLQSPLDGYFEDCTGCPPPSMDSCASGTVSGSETDVDCGGTECPPCTLGQACMAHRDCDTGNCMAFQCREPAAMPDPGGSAGTSGGGAAGTTGSTPNGGSSGGNTTPPTTGDCRSNTSLCMGPLQCCNAQGMCGIGVAPLCF